MAADVAVALAKKNKKVRDMQKAVLKKCGENAEKALETYREIKG